MPGIKLSIVMMTYQQGAFIDEAIQSVVSQQLPFTWELLIGDDASADNTSEVVAEWVRKFPDNIIYYQHEHNIGLHKNYQFLVQKAGGEYIALLEADDYWTDKEKSRRQVELMDSHPETAYSFTNSSTVDINGTLLKQTNFEFPPLFDLDFFVPNYIVPPNNTIIFRKSSEPLVYPDWFFSIRQWDTALHYLRGLNGKIGFIPINGLAWRRHDTATSFSKQFAGPERYKDWLILYREIGKKMPQHLKKYFKGTYSAYGDLAIIYLRDKKYFLFIKNIFLMFFNLLLHPTERPVQVCRDYFWKIRHVNEP